MRTETCLFGLITLELVCFSQGAVKIWQRDSDIRNPKHWVGDGPQKRCQGLLFPSASLGPVVLDGALQVETIVLPHNGELMLENDLNLVLKENSDDVMNCVELKDDFLPSPWMADGNWLTVDKESNVAVPHMERVPCRYDHVVFPKGIKSGSCTLSRSPVMINSLKFGNEYWTKQDIRRLSLAEKIPVFDVDILNNIIVTDEDCADSTGCKCDQELENWQVCTFVDVPTVSCTDPIYVTGFCTKICGARILVEPTASIRLFESMLKDYTSDTYVSKVSNGSSDVIQIVFAEKEFDGTSLDEARDLHKQLSKSYQPELYMSGPFYKEGQWLSSILSVVLGSLCGVAVVFGLIFLLNSKQIPLESIRNRLRFNVRPLSSYTPNFFARYDNSERVGLFSEGQSIAGSTLHLERTFENPSYGKAASESLSTSTDTINLNKDDDLEE